MALFAAHNIVMVYQIRTTGASSQACKQALHLLGPLIGSPSTNEMFQKHLLQDAQLIYGEFINDLAKVLVSTAGCVNAK